MLLQDVAELVEILGQRAGVDRVGGRRDSRNADRAATAPTVRGLSPEITFERDALLGEVAQRVGGVVADPLGEHHERRGT